MPNERLLRTCQALEQDGLNALVCGLPGHVLLLSGYWPVTGRSLAMVTVTGQCGVIVPEDEGRLANRSWAQDVWTYRPDSLSSLEPPEQAIVPTVREAAEEFGISAGRIGFEGGAFRQSQLYPSMWVAGSGVEQVLRAALPDATLADARALLGVMPVVKTGAEVDHIRTACRTARDAFAEGLRHVLIGSTEARVAAAFRAPLSQWDESSHVQRADGFVGCMSGPNAAEAAGAYSRSRQRRLRQQDLVLVHAMSFVDGYWSEVTRTYCLGRPDPQQQRMYHAVFDARDAALGAIRPGARAADVDAAARRVMHERGFGKDFRVALGHGVGFTAGDSYAAPALHAASTEVLQPRMVVTVAPGIYIDGYGGMRHGDVVAVTDTGQEVLTSFQSEIGSLVR
jgi:Xaa-Pro aminopeptidase/Xaa-Pro dipeptidase